MANRRRERKPRAQKLVPFFMFGLLWHQIGLAATEVAVGTDARFSDNARKSDTNESSDLEIRTFLTAGYKTDPGRCNADLLGTIGYSYWNNESFDNESHAEMDFIGDCQLINRLNWGLTNTLREVNQDTRDTDTPDNRTRKNVFSTGPSYVVVLNDTNFLNLSALYQNTEYDEPEENDSERYSGTVAWNHLFSSTFSAGLSSSASRTEFDYGAKVGLKTAAITFDNRWVASSIAGSIGMSKIETDYAASTQSSNALVGDVRVTREINRSTEWYLQAARELTDRSSTFDFRYEGFEFNLRESITVETYTLSTGIKKRFSDSSSLDVDLYSYQSDYQESNESESKAGMNIRFGRPLAELSRGYVDLGYDYLAFDSDDSHDNVIRMVLGVEHQASRELSLNASVGHNAKTSDIPAREYDENWVLIGLEYRLL